MKVKYNNFVIFLDIDGVLNTTRTVQRTPDLRVLMMLELQY